MIRFWLLLLILLRMQLLIKQIRMTLRENGWVGQIKIWLWTVVTCLIWSWVIKYIQIGREFTLSSIIKALMIALFENTQEALSHICSLALKAWLVITLFTQLISINQWSLLVGENKLAIIVVVRRIFVGQGETASALIEKLLLGLLQISTTRLGHRLKRCLSTILIIILLGQ